MKLLKNILLIFLIFSLVVPCAQAKKPAYYGYYGQIYIPGYGPTNRARMVASGPIAAGSGKLDLTSDNAFAEFGVDLSAYQDGNHYLEVTNDATGYKAGGFISAVAPGGATFDADLVTDGGFAAVTETNTYTSNFSAGEDGFSASQGAVAGNIDGIGGQDNNLRYTCNNAVGQYHTLPRAGLGPDPPGTNRAKAKYFVPSGQSNIDGSVLSWNGGAGLGFCAKSNVQDAWTQLDGYAIPPYGGVTFYIRALDGTAETFTDAGGDDLLYVREVEIYKVTFTNWTASSRYISPAVAAFALSGKVQYSEAATATLTQAGILTDKALYKIIHTLSSRTAGSLIVKAGTGEGASRSADDTYTEYITSIGTDLVLSATGLVGQSDAVSAERMTDCAVTGALILSTRGGATRAWSNQHASFNSNVASTYKIYRLPESRSLVAEGSISLYTNKLDSTTANAFFDSFDVSAYRDGNYYLELTDSASKKAGAYLATTVPGGATFDADLVTDGGFAAVTETNLYTSDFSAGVDSFNAVAGAVAGNIDGIGGQDNNLRFTCDTTDAFHGAARSAGTEAAGTYRGRAKYFVPSGQSNIDGTRIHNSSALAYTAINNVQDSWTQLDGYIVNRNNLNFYMRAQDGTLATFADAGGDDLLYIREAIADEITFTNWTASSRVISPAVAAYALANKVNFATATATLTQAGILTDKALYKIIHTLSSRTAGSLIVKAGTGEGASRSADGTYTEYITSIGTDLVLSATGLVGQSDAVSAERMTDCSITGAYLLSTRGGARGFAVYESGYRPDLAQTYKIYKLN